MTSPISQRSISGTIRLTTIADARGRLTVFDRIPFQVKRLYWLHHVEGMRGGHAHKTLRRYMIAVSGSFWLKINNEPIFMSKPDDAVYVSPMDWIEIDIFTPGAVCLVVCDQEYDAADYIRSRAEWEAIRALAPIV